MGNICCNPDKEKEKKQKTQVFTGSLNLRNEAHKKGEYSINAAALFTSNIMACKTDICPNSGLVRLSAYHLGDSEAHKGWYFVAEKTETEITWVVHDRIKCEKHGDEYPNKHVPLFECILNSNAECGIKFEIERKSEGDRMQPVEECKFLIQDKLTQFTQGDAFKNGAEHNDIYFVSVMDMAMQKMVYEHIQKRLEQAPAHAVWAERTCQVLNEKYGFASLIRLSIKKVSSNNIMSMVTQTPAETSNIQIEALQIKAFFRPDGEFVLQKSTSSETEWVDLSIVSDKQLTSDNVSTQSISIIGEECVVEADLTEENKMHLAKDDKARKFMPVHLQAAEGWASYGDTVEAVMIITTESSKPNLRLSIDGSRSMSHANFM